MAANSSITFLAVDAEPDNNCDLSAPLKLTWRYKAAAAIPAGYNWVVTYVFDVVEHAREAHLGSVACEPTAGASVHDAEFSCDYIDASGLPERHVCACQLNQDCTLTRYALLQLKSAQQRRSPQTTAARRRGRSARVSVPREPDCAHRHLQWLFEKSDRAAFRRDDVLECHTSLTTAHRGAHHCPRHSLVRMLAGSLDLRSASHTQ